MILDGRYRPSELRRALRKLLADLQKRQNLYTLGAIAGFFGIACFLLFLFVSIEDPGFSIFCAIASLIIGIGTTVVVFSGLRRRIAKVRFANGLLDQIFDDLHPARKFRYYLDTTSYSSGSKRYWSGTSMHGNAKYRYEDRWLRHKFQLIDGTLVTLERRADVKTRKGGIQKEKRRLYLKIQPNPQSFGPIGDTSGLEGLVRDRVREGFHDPPEQIRVDPQVGEDGLRVRISQWDAEIREAEAFQMLETVLLYLQMMRG